MTPMKHLGRLATGLMLLLLVLPPVEGRAEALRWDALRIPVAVSDAGGSYQAELEAMGVAFVDGNLKRVVIRPSKIA